jgi:hypothetical protein
VRICPNDALVFGRREELLVEARRRIDAKPDAYVRHVYGEHEAGGTNWLYLSSVPFEQTGFLNVGTTAPPRLTESLQHGIFKFFLPPAALYGLLGLVMWLTKRDRQPHPLELDATDESEPDTNGHPICEAGPMLPRRDATRTPAAELAEVRP